MKFITKLIYKKIDLKYSWSLYIYCFVRIRIITCHSKMEFQLSQIIYPSVLDALRKALGVPEERMNELRVVVDVNGHSIEEDGNVERFLPFSVFTDNFVAYLGKTRVSAAKRSCSGLFLSISGADGCTPPRDGARTVPPPVYRLEDAVEGEYEEEVQSGPILNYLICLYDLVPESVFQEFGWMSPEEYAVHVSNPSNIALSIRNGQVVSWAYPEYEHASLPFSAIPQEIRDDMRENGAFFNDEDSFQVNMVRAVRG